MQGRIQTDDEKEVNAWKTLQQEMIKKTKDLQCYDGFEGLYNGLKENVVSTPKTMVRLIFSLSERYT